jgi:tRNA1(Val) A37 N6-methylase TrmN6
LGCGIGSILLMISFNINNNNVNKFDALGIEVQSESVSLLNTTLKELLGKLSHSESNINVIQKDLRLFQNNSNFESIFSRENS